MTEEKQTTDKKGDPSGKPLQQVMTDFVKELAAIDIETVEQVRKDSDLATGRRRTYQIKDVKVQIKGSAKADEKGLSFADDRFDIDVSFSVDDLDGGALLVP